MAVSFDDLKNELEEFGNNHGYYEIMKGEQVTDIFLGIIANICQMDQNEVQAICMTQLDAGLFMHYPSKSLLDFLLSASYNRNIAQTIINLIRAGLEISDSDMVDIIGCVDTEYLHELMDAMYEKGYDFLDEYEELLKGGLEVYKEEEEPNEYTINSIVIITEALEKFRQIRDFNLEEPAPRRATRLSF